MLAQESIVITPEMELAGYMELQEYDPESSSPTDTVARIFRAMCAARQKTIRHVDQQSAEQSN